MAGATSGLARALRDRSRGYRGGGEVSRLPRGHGPAVRAGSDEHVQGAALGARLRMGALFLRGADTISEACGGGLKPSPCPPPQAGAGWGTPAYCVVAVSAETDLSVRPAASAHQR